MKNKYLIELVELGVIMLFIAVALVIISDAISDTNKIVIRQGKELQKLDGRIKTLETENKLYEYDLEQMNKYHNSEVD